MIIGINVLPGDLGICVIYFLAPLSAVLTNEFSAHEEIISPFPWNLESHAEGIGGELIEKLWLPNYHLLLFVIIIQ